MGAIQKSTLEFLNQLKVNNNREWFERNKERYRTAVSYTHLTLPTICSV